MSVFYLVFLLYFFSTCCPQSDLCLWGYNGTVNTFLNGLYQYNDGTYDSKPYFVMNDSDCRSPVYMYYMTAFQEWFIGSSVGTNSFYGRCETNDIQLPTECGYNWYVPRNLASQVYVQDAPCPSIQCDYIKVDMIGNNNNYCAGTFNKTGNNIYKKNSSDNVYFYFNYKMYDWMCASSPIITSCGVSIYGRDILQQFQMVSNSEYFLLLWNNNKTVNVTCYTNQENFLDQYCSVGCRQFQNGCNLCECNNSTSYQCNTINTCTSQQLSNDRCCCVKSANDSDYTRSSQACMNSTSMISCQSKRCLWQC